MNYSQKLLATAVAATLAVSVAPAVNAEVSASAAVASTYLWRGKDLGSGTPAVSGDLTYSTGGFYSTLWASSGDSTGGTEWDIGAGYGGEVGGFTYDISVWNYLYPTGTGEENFDTTEDQFGDLSEVILSLGYGPVSFSFYENIAVNDGDETYRYYTLGFSKGSWSALLGTHTGDSDFGTDEYTHLDVTYGYNDNLSFTFSQIVDEDDTNSVDGDLKFVVSYSIPIE